MKRIFPLPFFLFLFFYLQGKEKSDEIFTQHTTTKNVESEKLSNKEKERRKCALLIGVTFSHLDLGLNLGHFRPYYSAIPPIIHTWVSFENEEFCVFSILERYSKDKKWKENIFKTQLSTFRSPTKKQKPFLTCQKFMKSKPSNFRWIINLKQAYSSREKKECKSYIYTNNRGLFMQIHSWNFF